MQVRSRTMLALATGAILGISASMTGNVLADLRDGASADALPWEDARLLAEVLERVRRDYVDSVDDHALMENAVRGMVSALDPHSAFLDASEYDEIRASTTGSYPGVGIEVAAEPEGIKVLRPIEGSPAWRAGVRPGDLIVAIDGEAIGLDLDGAIERMRGPAGSRITLTLARVGTPAPIDVPLQRAQVAVHSVEHAMLEPGYGYLRITNFSETTVADAGRAIADLERGAQGALAGLVLDLRNNPGGVLEAAVEVSDMFLDAGVIVTAEGRTSDSRFRMDASPGDELGGAQLAVLVNGGSASAAEILAGALKDNRRAVLVGRTTYGKGSVQTVMPLSSGRAIKLTTSRYFTPSGASIQQKGIAPDIVIDGEAVTPDPATVATDREVRIALDALKSRRLAQLDR
ncbi:MAG: S41 family peptidase [Steroidobacteraceae bacterium]|nr:S41 family peptidase [Steroidobacteraceae bacterium]MCW5571976.1 S41 family peptidase [Steroidobacteraceae bacterium]